MNLLCSKNINLLSKWLWNVLFFSIYHTCCNVNLSIKFGIWHYKNMHRKYRMYGNDPNFAIIFVSAGKSYLQLFGVVYTLSLCWAPICKFGFAWVLFKGQLNPTLNLYSELDPIGIRSIFRISLHGKQISQVSFVTWYVIRIICSLGYFCAWK